VAPVSGPPDATCHLADTWADFQTPYLPSVNGLPYTGPLYGNFAALLQLKQLHPNLKVMISLGGASAANAAGFSYAASTSQLRLQLVASCIDLFIKGNVAPGISRLACSMDSILTGNSPPPPTHGTSRYC